MEEGGGGAGVGGLWEAETAGRVFQTEVNGCRVAGATQEREKTIPKGKTHLKSPGDYSK